MAMSEAMHQSLGLLLTQSHLIWLSMVILIKMGQTED